MDLTTALPADSLSASSPAGGTWPEAACWSAGYLPEAGDKRLPEWSHMESGSRPQSGGSPQQQQPLYTDFTADLVGGSGGGWSGGQAEAAKPAGSGRRILCRSQSEAGSAARMCADPSAGEMSGSYQPGSRAAAAAANGLSSAADLRLAAYYGQQGYEGLAAPPTAQHLFHARSDIQHCESPSSPPPPPPLLHSVSLGDMNGRTMGSGPASRADYIGSKLTGRTGADPGSSGHRPYGHSFSGQLVSSEGPSPQGFVDSMLKRGRGAGGAVQDSADSCSHCGTRHAVGSCPLADRGYPEKVCLSYCLYQLAVLTGCTYSIVLDL
jgi:hypothetical protein